MNTTSTKKVVFVSNFTLDRQQSMLRFAHALNEGMQSRGLETETWQPTPYFTRFVKQYRYDGLPKYLGYLDKFVRFPREIRRRLREQPPGTVYHITDHSNAVYASHFGTAPLLVTCHDLLQVRSALGEFPQHQVSSSGKKYQHWILKSISMMRHAACNSGKVRDDMRRLTGLPPDAVSVILLGLNFPYQPVPSETAVTLLARAFARHTRGWPQTSLSNDPARPCPPYFISVAGAQWYKNRTGLIKIMGELSKISPVRPLLIHIGPPLDPEQQGVAVQYGIKDSLIHLPSIENDELAAAYSLAEGLIFPSWEEGFGWPVAEAHACGCPVFASNREPMTEVGGQAARYFDPADPVSAAKVIADGLKDREELREAGLQRARLWEPARMMEEYHALYDRVISLNGPRLSAHR